MMRREDEIWGKGRIGAAKVHHVFVRDGRREIRCLIGSGMEKTDVLTPPPSLIELYRILIRGVEIGVTFFGTNVVMF